MTYTREDLIAICERAAKQATVDSWSNRDSASACQQLGVAWALLQAGVEFIVLDGENHPHHSESHLKTDDQTIWLHFDFPGFNAFESWDGARDRNAWDDETAYLPTTARLDARDGDWY